MTIIPFGKVRSGKTQKMFEEIKKNCTIDKDDPEKKCLICDVKYCPLILRRT